MEALPRSYIDRDAGKIGDLLIEASEAVKQQTLATVGAANKGNPGGLSR